jgi:hypothetical protein
MTLQCTHVYLNIKNTHQPKEKTASYSSCGFLRYHEKDKEERAKLGGRDKYTNCNNAMVEGRYLLCGNYTRRH